MTAIRHHFAEHRLHMVGCVAGGIALIVAIILGVPILGILGGLFCAVMMIGMVWMMFSMGSHRGH